MVTVCRVEGCPEVYKITNNAMCDHFGLLDDPSSLLRIHFILGHDNIKVGIIDTQPLNPNPLCPFRFRIAEVQDDAAERRRLRDILSQREVAIMRQPGVVISDSVAFCKNFPGSPINFSVDDRQKIKIGQHIMFNANWDVQNECFMANFLYVMDKQPLRWVHKPISKESRAVLTAFCVNGRESKSFPGFVETEDFGLVENRLGIKLESHDNENDGSSEVSVWVMEGVKEKETGVRMARTRFEVVYQGHDEPIVWHNVDKKSWSQSEGCLERPWSRRYHSPPPPFERSSPLRVFGFFQPQEAAKNLRKGEDILLNETRLQKLVSSLQRYKERIARGHRANAAVTTTSFHDYTAHDRSQISEHTLHERRNETRLKLEAGGTKRSCNDLHISQSASRKSTTQTLVAEREAYNSLQQTEEAKLKRVEQRRCRAVPLFSNRPNTPVLQQSSQHEGRGEASSSRMSTLLPEAGRHLFTSGPAEASTSHLSSPISRLHRRSSSFFAFPPRNNGGESSTEDEGSHRVQHEKKYHSNRFGSGTREVNSSTTKKTHTKRMRIKTRKRLREEQKQGTAVTASSQTTPFTSSVDNRLMMPESSLAGTSQLTNRFEPFKESNVRCKGKTMETKSSSEDDVQNCTWNF